MIYKNKTMNEKDIHDILDQVQTDHLFMENRVCRVCGVEKSLLADFYKCRKDHTLRSSYSYECKECAKTRVLENYHNDSVGTCDICGSIDTKLKDNICKRCSRALKEFGNNIDTLQKAVLYLERNK